MANIFNYLGPFSIQCFGTARLTVGAVIHGVERVRRAWPQVEQGRVWHVERAVGFPQFLIIPVRFKPAEHITSDEHKLPTVINYSLPSENHFTNIYGGCKILQRDSHWLCTHDKLSFTTKVVDKCLPPSIRNVNIVMASTV